MTELRANPARPESVTCCARAQLCAIDEDAMVRDRHVGALLAFSPVAAMLGNRVRFAIAHEPSARWAARTLDHRGVSFARDESGPGVIVGDPQIVLLRNGFQGGGRWAFGWGMEAALGLSRGAIHAAADISARGMRIGCPSVPLMLTLSAVMNRLGIAARATCPTKELTVASHTIPRVVVAPGDVSDALELLGAGETAHAYRQLRAIEEGQRR